ncbi:pro-sigmaK processing inhibitor BofA family protein [Halococcus sediminicola]|uniref:pro-sigmaK processing inhibitor BofA family protein n=1 Tax=Halococcus sediminicola TaxID=1264579 RepID=UPI000679AA66|nr:pro-sigmaK processing inhibitor BofA family protein [Halococcus sediminicola]
MVTGLELAVLAVALVLLLGAARILQAVRPLIVNAVIGLLVFLAASWFGIGVEINWLTLAVVAIGGLPGAILVVLLSVFGVAFTPEFIAPLV